MPAHEALKSEQAVYALGSQKFRVQSGIVYDSENNPVQLRAKSLRFLLFMLQERGRVVSKSELAEEVWTGLAVTDESISQCATDIRRLLTDPDHVVLENFPKRGYRLNADIEPESHLIRRSGIAPSGVGGRALTLVAAVVAVATIAMIWFVAQPELSTPSEPLREVVAVLPFQNADEAEGDGSLADGLAQDLTIRLAELSGVKVIPSSLAFSVTDNGLKAVSAARSLGARYVVDGTVVIDQQNLRIAIELIDGEKGTISWAGSFEGPSLQLVEFRDQIIEKIATSINHSISDRDIDRVRSTGTQNPDAYQQIILGRQAAANFTEKSSHLAEQHFRRAIGFDANHARAYAELAAIYAIRMENGWTILNLADEEKALFFAKKALALDPELWLGHYALGRLYSTFKQTDFQKSEYHLERAMALQPENDDARVYYAAVKTFQGKAEESIAILEPIVASHPNAPFWYHLSLGHNYFQLGFSEKAERALDQCLLQMVSSPYCLRYQIANYGDMGRLDDADWLVQEYAMLGFTPTVSAIMGLVPDYTTEHRTRLKTALRAAGLPD